MEETFPRAQSPAALDRPQRTGNVMDDTPKPTDTGRVEILPSPKAMFRDTWTMLMLLVCIFASVFAYPVLSGYLSHRAVVFLLLLIVLEAMLVAAIAATRAQYRPLVLDQEGMAQRCGWRKEQCRWESVVEMELYHRRFSGRLLRMVLVSQDGMLFTPLRKYDLSELRPPVRERLPAGVKETHKREPLFGALNAPKFLLAMVLGFLLSALGFTLLQQLPLHVMLVLVYLGLLIVIIGFALNSIHTKRKRLGPRRMPPSGTNTDAQQP